MSKRTDPWMQGYACALACVMSAHDEGVAVRDAIGCAGGYERFVASGADEYDLRWLRVALGTCTREEAQVP